MILNDHHSRPKLHASAFVFAITLSITHGIGAQTAPQRDTPLVFDVASVRQSQSTSTAVNTNVPLGPGNVYSPTGGLFRATNAPLVLYVAFAYRMNDAQLAAFRSAAPAWALQDRFDIQARTENTAVTKDQLRLMMRSLLGDRFGLVMHTETHESPAYAMVLAHPGMLGPHLRRHPSSEGCTRSIPAAAPGEPAPPETTPEGFATTCGGLVLLPSTGAGRIRIGASDVPISLIAGSASGWGDLGRPVVDETSLTGNYDFTLDYSMAASSPMASDADGPGFQQALKDQLGLKLESRKIPMQVYVLDRIDHMTPN